MVDVGVIQLSFERLCVQLEEETELDAIVETVNLFLIVHLYQTLIDDDIEPVNICAEEMLLVMVDEVEVDDGGLQVVASLNDDIDTNEQLV